MRWLCALTHISHTLEDNGIDHTFSLLLTQILKCEGGGRERKRRGKEVMEGREGEQGRRKNYKKARLEMNASIDDNSVNV